MLQNILTNANDVAKAYQSLIEALTMVSTAFAALVALWAGQIALRSQRLRVRFICHWSRKFIQQQATHAARPTMLYKVGEDVVGATLENFGLRDTKADGFSFRIKFPFSQARLMVRPVHDFGERASFDLRAGTSETLVLMDANGLDEALKSGDLTWFPRPRIRKMRFIFRAPTGQEFYGKTDTALSSEIKIRSKQFPLLLRY